MLGCCENGCGLGKETRAGAPGGMRGGERGGYGTLRQLDQRQSFPQNLGAHSGEILAVRPNPKALCERGFASRPGQRHCVNVALRSGALGSRMSGSVFKPSVHHSTPRLSGGQRGGAASPAACAT